MNNSTLFILNDAPYDNERSYNALRLAAALLPLSLSERRHLPHPGPLTHGLASVR